MRQTSALFFLVPGCLLVLHAEAQYKERKVYTTPLNRQLKPLPSDKHAFVIEERWLENGQWKAKATYTETGAVMAEYGYADSTRNTLHGKYTLYGNSRKKKREITYRMGQVDGPYAEWTGDGLLLRRGNLTGEQLWGNVELYTPEGRLKAAFQTDRQGNGAGREYLPRAGVIGEGAVKGGLQNGLWVYKDSTGKKMMEVVYNETGIVSETCFDADGKPQTGSDCKSDRMAEYPGGADAWARYLQKNLKYPKELRKEEIQGTVIVKFQVREDGTLANFKAVESPDPLLSAEAIRVIRESGKWQPAVEANKVVAYTHLQSITFQLK